MERRKELDEWEDRSIRIASEQLADIGGRLQRQPPEEVEAWIAEKYSDEQTRQMLMVAMILLVESRMFSNEEE